MRLWLVCLLFELLTVATRCTIAVITQAQFLSDDESTLYPLQSGKKDRVRKPQMRTISKSGSSEVNSQSSQTSLLRLSSRFESRTDNFPTTSLQFRSNGSPCFPAVYAVTLQNGHCSRRVSTKVKIRVKVYMISNFYVVAFRCVMDSVQATATLVENLSVWLLNRSMSRVFAIVALRLGTCLSRDTRCFVQSVDAESIKLSTFLKSTSADVGLVLVINPD